MLRPQDSATRDRKSLNGIWAFALDADGVGRSQKWFAGPLATDQDMAVPASFNDIAADAAVRDYVGDIWYQRAVDVPHTWTGERIVLHFESATHRATVWVGDVEVMSHEGGYTPFEADITDHVDPGTRVLITACVNNSLSFSSVPPGVMEDTPDGPRQRYWHDFFNYAGLHRTVWLYSTPRTRVDDVTVVTGLDGTTGTVDWTVQVAAEQPAAGSAAPTVRVRLADADGSEVATGTGESGSLSVPDVHPWGPGDGYLYELTVEVLDGEGPDPAVLDSYRINVGIRTVEVRGTEFLINGEPFYFKGFRASTKTSR